MALPTALHDAPLVPLLARVADADGRDVVWLLEAPLEGVEDKSSDPLGGNFSVDQFADDERECAETERAIEEILGDGILAYATPHNMF